MQLNINSRGYSKKVYSKLHTFEDFSGVLDDCITYTSNTTPIVGLQIQVGIYNNKLAIVFKNHRFRKIYYPNSVKRAISKNDFRLFCSYIFDNTMWLYDEYFFSGNELCGFGMDMYMPFLKEYEYEEI